MVLCLLVGERIGQTLVPGGLWEIVEPLIPPQRERPQGGGTRYVDDQAVFTAIVYVLTTGCAWRHLPTQFEVSKATAHRRFVAWTEAGGVAAAAPGGARPARRAGDGRLVSCGGRRGQRAGEKGGELTGPSPVDRGKPGSKLHALTDAAGLPLAVAVSAANTHDSLALIPLVQAVPAIRSRRGPRRRRPAKLHADKGYDYPYLRTWLRVRRISSRIACRGIETSTRLGRHRWVIERSFAWLTGYRRLTIRYERFRPAVHRIPHPRRRAHLRQEAHQVRQALSPWVGGERRWESRLAGPARCWWRCCGRSAGLGVGRTAASPASAR